MKHLFILLVMVFALCAAEDRRFVFVVLEQAGGAKALAGYPTTDPWSSVPQGRQTFDRVPFEVVTKVQLAGNVDSKDGRLYPARSLGLVVGSKLARLHVLHAGNISERDGRPMAALQLHYADGSTNTIFITYGVHVRNYWKDRAEKSDAVSDTNSVLVWTGRSDDADKSGASHRLYKTSLDLPPSDAAVESIDVFSLFSNSSLSIFALTGEISAGPATSAPAPADDASKYRDAIVLNVTDPAGIPVGGARARGVAFGERNAATTLGRLDDSAEELGVVPVDFPAGTRELRLVVAATGYVSSELNLQPAPGEPFRRIVPVRLEHGAKVGGIVRDSEGLPVPKAKVSIYRSPTTSDTSGKLARFQYVESTTDTRGRWTAREVPEAMEHLVFRVAHDDFRPIEMEFSGEGTGSLTRELLLASRSEFKFAPGLIISGTVQDESGRLFPDIEVTFAYTNLHSNGFYERLKRSYRTDGQGHFSFTTVQTGHAWVQVQNPDFVPASAALDLSKPVEPLKIILKIGRPLKLHVIEVTRPGLTTGPSLAGVTLTTRSGGWTAITDQEGRCVWEHPSEGAATGAFQGRVSISASLPGYKSRSQMVETALGEVVIGLERISPWTARVVDAESKEPLKSFTVTPGFRSNTRTNWYSAQAIKGRAGEFTINDRPASSFGTPRTIKIEASGYLPQELQVSPSAGFTNVFELQHK